MLVLRLTDLTSGKEFSCRKVKKSRKASRQKRLYEVRLANMPVRALTRQEQSSGLFVTVDFAVQSVQNHARVSQHPNVLALHEACEDHKYVYSITEYCDGSILSSQRGGHVGESQ